jgi:hypothetical protein
MLKLTIGNRKLSYILKDKIYKIEGEDVYLYDGRKIWILYLTGLFDNGKTLEFTTMDMIKIGNAMSEIGYGDKERNEYRVEVELFINDNQEKELFDYV